MSTYTPDKWVIMKTDVGGTLHYRVLASWYGGYLGSDSWKMSSGIVSIIETEEEYGFSNESGSLYRCFKNSLGTSMTTYSVFEDYKRTYENNIFEIISTQDLPLGDMKL
jgi:hypothetical protein